MDQVAIRVQIVCPDVDEEGLALLARDLRAEIAETNVDDVQPVEEPGKGSSGAKSSGAMTIGALAVTLAPVVAGSLMGVVASWLNRQPSDVEIEIDGMRFKGRVTKAQRDALVAHVLRKIDPAP